MNKESSKDQQDLQKVNQEMNKLKTLINLKQFTMDELELNLQELYKLKVQKDELERKISQNIQKQRAKFINVPNNHEMSSKIKMKETKVSTNNIVKQNRYFSKTSQSIQDNEQRKTKILSHLEKKQSWFSNKNHQENTQISKIQIESAFKKKKKSQ